jgi:hypothetical protein
VDAAAVLSLVLSIAAVVQTASWRFGLLQLFVLLAAHAVGTKQQDQDCQRLAATDDAMAPTGMLQQMYSDGQTAVAAASAPAVWTVAATPA